MSGRSPNTSREKRAARHREPETYRDHNAVTAHFFDRTNKRRSRRRANRWLRRLQEEYVHGSA